MGEDKGKYTVVQGKEDYEKRVNKILSDQNPYERLSKILRQSRPTNES